MTYESFIQLFDKRSASGKGVMVRCPAHQDKAASLSVGKARDGGVVLKCFAGCSAEDVVAKMSLKMSDLFVEKKPMAVRTSVARPVFKPKPPGPKPVIEKTYSYTDALGKELYQAVRLKPKDFRQRHAIESGWAWNMDGVERVLYRLPEVIKASEVWIVEGEKDADNLAALGFCATCNVGGAGKWLDGYSETLAGKKVVICGDNDEPGRKHVDLVFDSVSKKAESVKVVNVPSPFKDASDLVAANNGTSETLLKELRDAAIPHYGGVRMPVYSMAELQSRYVKQIKASDEVSVELSKWLPSFKTLRRLTPGSFVLVIGDTGTGKTNVLLNVPMTFPHLPALYFELELTGEEMYERAWAHKSGLPGKDVETEHRHAAFPDDQVMAHFPNLFVCDETRLSPKQIEAIINKSELKIGRKPVLVLIDYAQLVSGKGERYERVSDAAEELKMIAKSTRTIVFLSSQIDRQSGKSGNIGLHSGKDSGALENSASVALTVKRDPEDATLMILTVVKATKGGAGTTVMCNYDGATARITERTNQPEPE